MLKFRDFLKEAQITNDEAKKALETLIENGDEKVKEFAKGVLDYYEENGSFHPNQVAGLQNIMKNASFQLADK